MTVKAKWLALAALAYSFLVPAVLAQDALSPNQPITQTIAAGGSNKYQISLRDGDYVEVRLATQSGEVSLVVTNPDGTLMRGFDGLAAGDNDTYAFAAEGGGMYSLNVRNQGTAAATYELKVTKIVSLDERFQPSNNHAREQDPSPHIEALKKQIATGDKNTAGFWRQVEAGGGPLIERLNENYWLVTFLWRAQHDTRSVKVISYALPGPTSSGFMQRIGDSDVWYLTAKVPKGARFNYRLLPNSPLDDETQATSQADVFNPKRKSCPATATKYGCRSVVELPDAVPQPWIVSKPGTPAGKIEKATIKSAIQKLERNLFIYLPAGYKADGPPNDLVVWFDGDDILDPEVRGQTTLDNLIAAGKIPSTVVVMVDNVRRRRLVDLVANPEFADFMARELIPWARAHYNVTHDASRTVVGGESAGGLAAAFMGLKHSEVFGNVFSQSGAFWWSPEHSGGVCASACPETGGRHSDPDSKDSRTEGNFIARQFVISPKLPVRFFLDAGTFETDREGAGGDILEGTRTLRDVLLSKGYEVHFQQAVSGHDDLSWRGTFADGLIALLGRP